MYDLMRGLCNHNIDTKATRTAFHMRTKHINTLRPRSLTLLSLEKQLPAHLVKQQ